MAGTLQKVRLIVACGYGDVGFEFTPNGVTRDWLLANAYAVIVEAETPARPAKFSSRAAKKLGEIAKNLI